MSPMHLRALAALAGIVAAAVLGPSRPALADEGDAAVPTGFVQSGLRPSDEGGLDLQWVAADGCPDGASARAAIDRYVGERGQGALGPVSVRVELAPDGDGAWQGRVALRSRSGQGDRVFHGPSCDQVAEAATLIVAILLEPLKTTAKIREEASAPPPSEPAVETAHVELGVQTSGDVGSLPAPTVGVGLVLGVRAGSALVDIQGSYWAPQRADHGPVPGSGGEMGLYAGSLRACVDVFRPRQGRFRLDPCARVELGLATGVGFGLPDRKESRDLWGAALGGLSAWLSSAPLSSWISVEIGTPFARPIYRIDGYDSTVFRASPVLLRASSGVAWSFP
jgi:hypothetical protein